MPRKVVARIVGGLGNQLFSFAAAYAFSRKNNCELILDNSFFINDKKYGRDYHLDTIFPQYNSFSSRFIHNRVGKKIHALLNVTSNEEIYNEFERGFFETEFKHKIYINGYRQDVKYFYEYKHEISEMIKFSLSPKVSISADFRDKLKNGVCVHYRSYDEVDSNDRKTPVDDFYISNIKKLMSEKNVREDEVFVFSDNIKKARLVLKRFQKANFIEKGVLDDFFMMSMCKYFVISNSSYSWWAAYISDSECITYPRNSNYPNYPSPCIGWNVE